MESLYACAILLAIVSSALCAKSDLKWQNDVYTGRHLDGLITLSTETDGYIVSPAILFMYKPECVKRTLALVDIIKRAGPPESFLTIAKHDYDTVHKHIWYKLDKQDDLTTRYIMEGDRCLKILFFQPGFHVEHPFVWDENANGTLLDWVWSFIGVKLGIKNSMSYNIKVYTEGNGNKHFLAALAPGESTLIASHFTRAITCYNENDQPIYAVRITHDLRDTKWNIDVNSEMVDEFTPWENEGNNYWLRNMHADQYKTYNKKWTRNWQLAEGELITYKQPLLLERFTDMGYSKRKIPKQVYRVLRGFYDNSQHTRLSEGDWDDMEPNINTDSVQTTMIPLTDEVRAKVSDALLKTMETWCNCKLETTAFYGIREYYHGNILRMHVDNVETHIISSILLIHKKLETGKEDWSLQVIDYTGERRNVTLEEGEMLLYESGTLIHGRPLPYEGTIFANCFLHYKPVEGWKWKRYYQKTGPIITDGSQTERVDVIDTELTLRDEYSPKKDEL